MSDSKFVYLLNAMEAAAQSDDPYKNGYGGKRLAVLAFVDNLEREVYALADLLAEARGGGGGK